jgi:putative transposase
MDWKKLLGSVTESVDEELRLRNAYLVAENRILRQQINGRVPLTDSDRKALAEIGQRLPPLPRLTPSSPGIVGSQLRK